jgi:hypothetical protein
MSALGHKRTMERLYTMSALPPKADITELDSHGRFGPKAEVALIQISGIDSSARCEGCRW